MRTGTMGKLLSLDARGKFGFSGGFGRIAFGYNRLGFYNWYCGMYQKKYYYGKPHISRQRFAWGKNNQLEKQQLWRGVFADGKVAYDNLTNEDKQIWRIRGGKRRLTGYNCYMSEWLKDHKSILN